MQIEKRNFRLVTLDIVVAGFAKGTEMIAPACIQGSMSCSVIELSPSTGFEKHTHPSDHVLVILSGGGVFNYSDEGEECQLIFEAGDVFPVPGQFPHAVSAGNDGLRFLSIANPARTLEDKDRMHLVN